ncbi:protein giant-like [Neodiprion virginianus]|uniref:protein giant-like n=1 Tax=Neodiprion virginianus TaxID=2961670 RepID=UPI001EE74CDC|nr:protein giant-like [Neodiprion virginianus]
MDTTSPLDVESIQPLDYTATQSTEGPNAELDSAYEVPVLDLSCRRDSSQKSLSHSLQTTVQKSEEEKCSKPYVDDERKSPSEGRSYMVTPPSEGDSPTKARYEPIYNQINSTTSDLPMPIYPVLGLNAAVTLASTQSALQTNLHNAISQGYHISRSRSMNAAELKHLDNQMYGLSVTHAAPVTPAQSPQELGKKLARPFKAYPKDPLTLNARKAELAVDPTSNEAYSEFRKRMLESVKKTNEGTNIKMRRTTKSPGLPTSTMDDKDAAYWERRRKNNEAAKRSRDARRAKEDEIAIRAAFLEQENIKLKVELVALRNETAKLRCMVYSS